MRSDMKKVVTERPRAGGGIKQPKGSNRQWQRYDEDSYPKGEKIRAKWTKGYDNAKEFTDVLGPLYHYLLKQVGRKWDAVYSDVVKNLPKGSVQNDHIYTHIWQFVEKNVVIIDGQACYNGTRTHGVPIRSSGRYDQLYVNPVTNLLCKAKKGKNRYSYGYSEHEPYLPGVKVYPGVQYHKVKGVWYEVKVEEIKGKLADGVFTVFGGIKDEVLGRRYHSTSQLREVYGGDFIATSKRQMKKREIRFANLN